MRITVSRDAAKLWLFYVDAEAAYPLALEEMGVTDTPTQFDLEFAHNVIKLDAQMAIRTADPPVEANKTPVIIIDGGPADDAAYKERWGVKYAPPGKLAEMRTLDVTAWEKAVAAEAKAWYQRTRGYLPN